MRKVPELHSGHGLCTKVVYVPQSVHMLHLETTVVAGMAVSAAVSCH